nr:hypothetical protein [uncultured Rhodopila sp.]
MLKRLVSVPGLLAALLALMVQLGIGASVPRPDPLAQIAGAGTLCHAPDGGDGPPNRAPMHPLDCLVCPLCAVLHAQPAALVSGTPMLAPSAAAMVVRPELPPPSTAPPGPQRPPSQPRAPPIAA